MVSAYLNGRLGNQMFQYAVARATAERVGCNFFIPDNRDEAVDLYGDVSGRFGVYLELYHPENPHHWVGQELFDLDLGRRDAMINRIGYDPDPGPDADGLFLHGFFQSDRHFADIRKDVQRWFTVADRVVKASAHIRETHDPDSTCYIHFRGGDYKKLPDWYLPTRYYHDAMDLVSSINPDVRFLVVTDDKEEAGSVLPGIKVVSNSPAVDFFLLNRAKWCIIPNSTFSWWACWLNDENFVVAPDGWLNHNSGGDFNPAGIQTPRFKYIKKY